LQKGLEGHKGEKEGMEMENKPQPMAGFAVGIISPAKRTMQVKRKQTQATQLNPSEKIPKLELGQVWFGEKAGGSSQSGRWEQGGKSEEAPPLRRRLTPMSELLHSLLETETSSRGANDETESNQMPMSTFTISEETPPPSLTRNLTPMSNLLESLLKDTPIKERGEGPVFFPVEVDTDKLLDWKEKLSLNPSSSDDENLKRGTDEDEENNNELERATLVNVNNTDIALFKYGETIIATESKCPHAGGPLHLADIEILPDKSLCVRCPWHKWAFCVSSNAGDSESPGKYQDSKVGSCVFPTGRSKTLQVFSTEVSKSNRRHIKIGFESIPIATLVNQPF